MWRYLFIILIAMANESYADHPHEGSDKLPDLINEALATSPNIRAKSEFVLAAKERISGTKAGLAPTLSAAGGRKTEGGGDSNVTGSNFAQLDATWNLYRGGLDRSKQQSSDVEFKIASQQLQAEKLEIATAVAKTFFELQYIGESIDLIDSMISLTQSGKDAAKRRLSTGQSTSVDALEFDILDSKLRSQRAAYQADESSLIQKMRMYIGRSEATPIKVKGHLVRSSWQVNSDELTKRLLSENPNIVIAALNTEKARLELSAVNAAFMPSIDASGSWGKLASSTTSGTKPSWSTELRLTVPLFSGLSTVSERRSKSHDWAGFELEELNTKRTIQAEFSEHIVKLKSLEQRLTLEENSVAQAEKYLKLTKDEYARGIKNSPDLAAAMDLVLAAHLRNLELRRDWYQAKMHIQSISGSIPST